MQSFRLPVCREHGWVASASASSEERKPTQTTVRMERFQPGLVAHNYKSSMEETTAIRLLWVQGQSSLQ